MGLEKIHKYRATCDKCEVVAEYESETKNALPEGWDNHWVPCSYAPDRNDILCKSCYRSTMRHMLSCGCKEYKNRVDEIERQEKLESQGAK